MVRTHLIGRPLSAALAALALSTSLVGTAYAATAKTAASSSLSDSSAHSASSTSANAAVNDPTRSEFSQAGTIDETVLIDEAGIKITATGLTYTSSAVELDLVIENNTDQDLEFLSGTLGYSINSVNGVMVDDGYLSCDVAAGKKAKDAMSFSYRDLMVYGITEISDIEVGIYTSDGDWTTDDFYSGPRRVVTQLASTYGYDKNFYQSSINSKELQTEYDYTMPLLATDVLYDQAGVSLISEGLLVNKDGESALMLEFVNNSPELLRIETSDISINGLQVQGSGTWSGDSIAPFKHRIVQLKLSSLLDQKLWGAFGIKNAASVGLTIGLENSAGDDVAEPLPITVTTSKEPASVDPAGTEVYNNGAGLRIVSKGIVDSPKDYNNDVYALFIIENTSGQPVDASLVSGSASTNGFMADTYSWSADIPDGQSSAAIVELTGSSLEENDITGAADITELELAFEFRDMSYATIDEPTVTVTNA